MNKFGLCSEESIYFPAVEGKLLNLLMVTVLLNLMLYKLNTKHYDS